MKVLLRKNVFKLGKIGEVVEVRPGYARNYLLPQGLAFTPTEANLRAVDADRQRYLDELADKRTELEALAAAANGKEVTISARANEEGHLYGSVGPAQIGAALTELGVFVEPEQIQLGEPIRRLDRYDVAVRFEEGITATVHVWVVPVHEPGDAPEDVVAEGVPNAGEAAGEAPPAGAGEVDETAAVETETGDEQA